MKIVCVLSLAVLLIGCGGYGSSSNSAPQPGIVPAIAALAPASTNAGGPGFTLTVNGSNFGNTAVVKWNGAAQTTMFITGNQLTATIPAAMIATPGTVPVTVTNPGTPGGGQYGGGGTSSETSNSMSFTVN